MANFYPANKELQDESNFPRQETDPIDDRPKSGVLIDSQNISITMGNANKVHKMDPRTDQQSMDGSPSLGRQNWLQGFLNSCTARVLRTSSQSELNSKPPNQRTEGSLDTRLIHTKKMIGDSLADQFDPNLNDSACTESEKSILWPQNTKRSSIDQKSSILEKNVQENQKNSKLRENPKNLNHPKNSVTLSLDRDFSPKNKQHFVSSVLHTKWNEVVNKKSPRSNKAHCFLATQPTSLNQYRQTEVEVFSNKRKNNYEEKGENSISAFVAEGFSVPQRDFSPAADFSPNCAKKFDKKKFGANIDGRTADFGQTSLGPDPPAITGNAPSFDSREPPLPTLPGHVTSTDISSGCTVSRASLRRSSAVDYPLQPSTNQEPVGSFLATPTNCAASAVAELSAAPTDQSPIRRLEFSATPTKNPTPKNVAFSATSTGRPAGCTGILATPTASFSTAKKIDSPPAGKNAAKNNLPIHSVKGASQSAVGSAVNSTSYTKPVQSKNSDQRHFLRRTKRTIASRSVSGNESILKKLIGVGSSYSGQSLTKSSLTDSTDCSGHPSGSNQPQNQTNFVQKNMSATGSQSGGTIQYQTANPVQNTDGQTIMASGVSKSSRDSIKVDFSSESLDFRWEEKLRRRVFAHYDCYSVCASPSPLLSGTSRLNDDNNLNAATGASRASSSRPIAGGGVKGAATSATNCGGSAAVSAAPSSTASSTATATVASANSPPGGGSQSSSSQLTLSEESGASGRNDAGDGKNNSIVRSCSYFRNEIGGEPLRMVSLSRSQSLKSQSASSSNSFNESPDERETLIRPSTAAEASILENLSNVYLGGRLCASRQDHLVFEYVDQGAFYYRHCFAGKAHQNYFGSDEYLGPVAISIIRDRVETPDKKSTISPYMYRIIVRLCDARSKKYTALFFKLNTFRGAIMEESLPSYQLTKEQQPTGGGLGTPPSAAPNPSGKVPVKELIELTVPEVQLGCLKMAYPVPRTEEMLLKLDEQMIYNRYKVGILYCGPNQCTEEDMYNSKIGSPAFDEFLDMLGQRVRLKGFDKYKGGLDNKGDTTGQYSLYTSYQQCEIMFHVSTMLPYTSNNVQQLSRKRHIGNDIVTVIFQDEGALPFSAHTVRSHFQHVFIIVRVHNPNTDHVKYSLAVSRCKDVPPFGPPIHAAATFPKSKEFRDFLLTKMINGENAVHKSDKFVTLSARTRKEFMKDLAENHVTSHYLESATGKIDHFRAVERYPPTRTFHMAHKRGTRLCLLLPIQKLAPFFTGKILGSKRRDRPKPRLVLDASVRGCIVWDVQVLVSVEDFNLCQSVDCFLGISADYVVLIEREKNQDVLFCIQTHSIIGWTSHKNSLKIYFDHADVVIMRTTIEDDYASDMQDIAKRLQAVTKGCDTVELILRRNIPGQLGFHIQHEGIVSDVEMYGSAWQSGLRQGARLVEIAKLNVATLTLNRMLDLLITSTNIRVSVIPPAEDGSPRRGCEDPYCPSVLTDDFSHSTFLTEQPIFYKNSSRRVPQRKPRIAPTTVLTLDPDSADDFDPTDINATLSSKSLDELQQIRRRHSDECRSNSADLTYQNSEKVSTSSAGARLCGSVGHVIVSESVEKVFETENTQKKGKVEMVESKLNSASQYVAKFRANTISSSSSSEASELYKIHDPGGTEIPEKIPSLKPLDLNKKRRKDSGARRSSDDRQFFVRRSHALCHNLSNSGASIVRKQRAMSPRHVSQSSGQLTVPGQKPQTVKQLSTTETTEARTNLLLEEIASDESCSRDLKRLDYSSESERGVEWSSLVDAATRAIESIAQKAMNMHSSPDGSSYKLKFQAAQQRVAMLEEKVDRVQLELVKERENRRIIELQLLNEKNLNKKLDEESVNSNLKLKKFAEWFVNAVESTNSAPNTSRSDL